jgi:cyclic-di-GMP-binding biofilm dispersal mediator protein
MEAHMSDFAGKEVLVIGGSRGIGAAIVRRFAAGDATVTFTYLRSHNAAMALAEETGATALLVDSADRDALVRAVADRGAWMSSSSTRALL